MTNTLNTPVEALEMAFPLRVERYEFRTGSGGIGVWRGGEGVVRSLRLLPRHGYRCWRIGGGMGRAGLLAVNRVSRGMNLSTAMKWQAS